MDQFFLNKISRVTIEDNIEIAPGSYILSFHREFSFLPGQVISIFFGRDNTRRIYSIASGANEQQIKILYKVNPFGLVTPQLKRLKSGNILSVSVPYGSFTGFSENAVCIATGTGIAPFASLFFSGTWNDKILIHGSRTHDEFYFAGDFQKAGISYIRCCSGERSESTFFGRVTDYLTQQKEIDTGRKYYLCGKAEMVVDVRDILIEKGVAFNSIFAEIYF